MARRLGPDGGMRLVILPSGTAAANKIGTVYADSAGTVLADVLAYQPSNPTVPGAPIAGSVVTTDDYGLLPLFWWPDGVNIVWITVNGGPLVAINSDYDARLGALESGRVPTTRTITAGTGLTGGGSLAADRTLAVAYGSTAGTAAQGNDSRLSDARTPTPHAATHATAGSDPVTVAQSQVSGLGGVLTAKADLVGGVLPTSQLPSLAVVTYLGTVAGQAAMLALVGQQGDWAIRSDLGTSWVITGADPTQLANWTQLAYPTAPVLSVNAQTGPVILAAADVGAPPTTRLVSAGTGLTGGGSLAADRTIAVAYGTAAGTSTQGNDSRLSDPRTPTAHATTHGSAGSDPVTVAQSQVTGLATTLTAKADLVGGVLPTSQLPSLAVVAYLGSVASQAAMLALVGQQGDWTIRTDLGTTWVITGADPTQVTNWTQLSYPTAPVQSVNTQVGTVVLSAANVGAPPVGRLISAGNGLSGGGDLSSDRALAVVYGSAAGTAVQGDDVRVATLPASNAVDDTSAINAVLTASAGRRVRGRPGANYLISAPIVVYSGTQLDMTGCTITLLANSGGNLLNNRAVSQVRRVIDAAMTASSTTLTSATGAFTGADVGKAVVVHGAGPSGALLSTTITSVTNATTAVLTATASTTVSATYAAVGPRDSGISIQGGTWTRATPNGGANGWDLHALRLRHIDGLVIRDLTVSTLAGKYAISLGDTTDAKVRDITFSAFSDGVHIQGPAARTHIAQIRGTTADDTVVITPRDWTAYDEVFGHVEDTLLEDVSATSTAARLVKVLGGSPATAVRRTIVQRVAGSAAINAVIIGDDTSQANTTGGLVEDLLIQDIHATCPAAQNLIMLTGRNMSRLRVSGVEFDNASATVAVVTYAPTAAAVLDSLIVERVRVKATGAAPVIRVDLNATVSRMLVDGVDVGSTVSGASVLSVRAVVTDLILRSVTGALVGSSNVLILPGGDTTAQVARASIAGVHVTGTGGSLVNAVTSTQVLPRLEISNVVLSGLSWLADLATTTELHLSNVTTISPGAGIMNVRATAALLVRGAGLNLALGAQNIAIAAGGTVTSKTFALEVDVSKLLTTANSMAYNTNAALAVGVGPVIADGTSWTRARGNNTPVLLTDAATIATDAALGNLFRVTLGANRTLGNPTGAYDGQLIAWDIKQDATGGRTIDLAAAGSKFRFGTDLTAVVLTTTPGKTDKLGVRYHLADDKFDVIAFVKGF